MTEYVDIKRYSGRIPKAKLSGYHTAGKHRGGVCPQVVQTGGGLFLTGSGAKIRL